MRKLVTDSRDGRTREVETEHFIPVVDTKDNHLTFIKNDGYYPDKERYRYLTEREFERNRDTIRKELGFDPQPVKVR